jgi:hypothetical protein
LTIQQPSPLNSSIVVRYYFSRAFLFSALCAWLAGILLTSAKLDPPTSTCGGAASFVDVRQSSPSWRGHPHHNSLVRLTHPAYPHAPQSLQQDTSLLNNKALYLRVLPCQRQDQHFDLETSGCHHTAAAAMDDYADFLFPKNSTKTLQGSSALLTTLVSCTALLYLKHVWTLTMQVCLFHCLCALVGERMHKGKGGMPAYAPTFSSTFLSAWNVSCCCMMS